ncbi:TPA: hypothetical protein DD449_05085 [Candidatus Berkelbacteria bacterium]|uniref:Uncharacterized protein n=1 Tax=Berkelbacteria bacterium GW2011_GWE1_39_12 TaxID=1618337 RepID=A0A0G4B4A4_9BACT|nr:MAG: hypothetical protein UT28_C0001G0635 [Berkelbacteria bacterium GW2011_GWE1_39_12]HBO61027.1 hypothetical protein [Candidatus Berkelbacteria bacterium]
MSNEELEKTNPEDEQKPEEFTAPETGNLKEAVGENDGISGVYEAYERMGEIDAMDSAEFKKEVLDDLMRIKTELLEEDDVEKAIMSFLLSVEVYGSYEKGLKLNNFKEIVYKAVELKKKSSKEELADYFDYVISQIEFDQI